MHFSGTINKMVDGKGRVSIPADFRRGLELGDPEFSPETKRLKMRVVYGDPSRKCLEIYPISVFNDIMDRVALLPEGSDDREVLELFYVSGSQVVEADGDGRSVWVQHLRDHIGLPRDGGEVMFAGAVNIIRVWTPEEFQAERLRKLEAVRPRMKPGGSVLSLLPPKKEG